MTSHFVVLLLAFASSGALAGALAVPVLADISLKRAYARSLAWWYESLQKFRSFRCAHPDAYPTPRASGSEGALGVWFEDAKSQATRKVLTHERADALRSVGVVIGADASTRSEQEQAQRCTFRARVWQRAVLAVGCAAWFVSPLFAGMPLHLAVVLAFCGVAMAVSVVCDLRARMIPLECCAALLAAGATFQFLVAGFSGLLMGCAVAAAVFAVCWVANSVSRAVGGSVGQGDVRCMAALSVLCGPASLVGAAACYIAAALFSAAGLVTHRLDRKSGIPMAPFLALWLVFGTVVVR